MKEKFGNQVDPDITLDEYIDFGISVGTTNGNVTNHENLTEVNYVVDEDSTDEKNENTYGELVANPEVEEVRKAVQILENFSLFSQYGKVMLRALKHINCSKGKAELYNKKQACISDLFAKE